MQFTEEALSVVDAARTADDLGPLAWVLEELRKVLYGTGKTLRRFARDAASARANGTAPPSPAALEAVPQQLHQSVGALEMVELSGAAVLLRSMETAAAAFALRPELCTESAAATIERAGAALVEYLETVLAQKAVSALALFPQYRDVTELAEGEKAHPADLWTTAWRWAEPRLKPLPQPLGYEAAVRARLDQAVLRIVKSADAHAAREISDISLGLAAGQRAERPSIFWQISAAFFEALALGLLPTDLYIKRLASRILLQYSALSRGDEEVAPLLVRDLLFYCAHGRAATTAAPVLAAVRDAFGLTHFAPVDYETRRFGRFDPVLLAQIRKRIHTAAESWSQAAGGDTAKLRLTGEHFQLLAETMLQLQPESMALAHALRSCAADVVRSGRAPAPALAMEIATSVLYLQAAYEDLDQDDERLRERIETMAQRLKRVRSVGQTEPLEPWMEELYRRVSDRQTMGSVVEEMRASLAQIEKSLDEFVRDGVEREALTDVSSHLSQIRGVLSVLGLEHAAHAATRMRDSIDRFIAQGASASEFGDGGFEKLGNNLGALGFLVDMLSYQPALARKLFVYDETLGELKPVMGRVSPDAAPLDCAVAETPHGPTPAAIEERPLVSLAEAVQSLPALEATLEPFPAAPILPTLEAEPAEVIDVELLDIFLDEAREVVVAGLASVDALATQPLNASEQAALRRAFHTLKGSSRMVGMAGFGEAAWSMEQLHNHWLAEQKPVDLLFLQLSRSALHAFGDWVQAIADGAAAPFTAIQFGSAADALRLKNRLVSIESPVLAIADAAETPPKFEVDEAGIPAVAAFAEPQVIADAACVPSEQEFLAAEPTEPMPLCAPEHAGVGVTQLDLTLEGFEPGVFGPEIVEPETTELETTALPEAGFEPMLEPQAVAPEAIEPDLLDIAALKPEFVAPEPQPILSDAIEPQLILSEMIDTAPAELHAHDEPANDAVKIIGGLRVGIPLYQVYLGEADEWARLLSAEISEWALAPGQPVSESAIAYAHSLAGSSATVGFTQLSMLSRTLERALGHAQLLRQNAANHVQVFVTASEEISRLLHQFAAGFLRDADLQVLEALAAVLDTEVQSSLPNASVFGPDALGALIAGVVAPTAAPAPATPAIESPQCDEVDPPLVSADDAPVAANDDVGPATAPQAVLDEPARTVLPDAPAAVAKATSLDDDIDAVDAIDPDLFPVFEDEALELLPQLGGALRQWFLRPDDKRALGEIQRVLHTLKGSARLAGAARLGEMAHRMESDIAACGSDAVSSAQIEPLLGSFDALQTQMDLLRGIGVPVAHATEAVAQPQPEPAQPAQVLPPVGDVRPASVTVAAAGATTAARQGSQSVRVRAQLLDRLVNQAGEITMTRTRLEARVAQLRDSLADLTGNLERLRQQLRDVELQAETQMQSRLAQSKDSGAEFDPLEFDRYTRVQELARMMAESVNDVATVQRSVQRAIEGAEDDLVAQARQSRELQRDLLRTRMVEFEAISERLYAVVRQAAKDSAKQVRLDITGGTIEMDRGMLERLAPAFEHLLRNAVVHGIESPEQRVAAGKPAVGTIGIELRHSGNDVSVECRDDGAGLDLHRIRQKAIDQGRASAAQPLSDDDAAQMIFAPGFTTASEVTELAGRGVGMDVVRSEVTALGGRIDLDTRAGEGTGFTMVLPLTTAVTQIVMLRAGEQRIGVPAVVVELVRRLPVAEIDAAYAGGTLSYAGESLPFHWCGALLQSSARSAEPMSKNAAVLIVRSASQRLALHVDEVLGTHEVVVKNLGPQLARLPGLAGMSVLASGAVTPIYNPVALSNVYGQQTRQWALAQQQQQPQARGGAGPTAPADEETVQAPLVLVVDDSITVRRVTQRLLQREGFRVALAADGLQALERLRDELPVMVLSDIEMPRMDGFDLARNIRGDAAMCDLPIVMITSRIGDKHRDHAAELGVQHYLGKPYSEEGLLRLVRRFAQSRAPARLH